jgi:hypothetical protein
LNYGELQDYVTNALVRRSDLAGATDTALIHDACRAALAELQRAHSTPDGRRITDGNWRALARSAAVAYTESDVTGVDLPADYKSGQACWYVTTSGELRPIPPASPTEADLLRMIAWQNGARVLTVGDTPQRWYEFQQRLVLLFPETATLQLDYQARLTLPAPSVALRAVSDWFSTTHWSLLAQKVAELLCVYVGWEDRAEFFQARFLQELTDAWREDQTQAQGGAAPVYRPPLAVIGRD